MKKIDLYQCEICGTQFSDKKLCEKCERGHVTDILIRKSRYLPITPANHTGRKRNANNHYPRGA